MSAASQARRASRHSIGLVRCLVLSVAIPLIAGCAIHNGARGQIGTIDAEKTSFWTGRLALQVASDPPQSFFASFELQGNAVQGSLSLFSPVSTVAVLNWTPSEALLRSGSATAQPQRYDNAQTMLSQVTGAPIPLAALFDWLRGQASPVPGWQVDLTRQAEGHIQASRISPSPALDLRVVLEKE